MKFKKIVKKENFSRVVKWFCKEVKVEPQNRKVWQRGRGLANKQRGFVNW